jgi:hypothetical protein
MARSRNLKRVGTNLPTLQRGRILERLNRREDPRKIAVDEGVSPTTVYGMRKAQAEFQATIDIEKVAGEVAPQSQRQRILRVLAEQGPFKELRDLERATVGSGEWADHDSFTVLLWALSRSGDVKFKERKRAASGSARSVIEDIELTPSGYRRQGSPLARDIRDDGKRQPPPIARVVKPTSRPLPAPGATVAPSDRKLVHPAGVDGTNPRYLPGQTVGGPVTRRYEPPAAVPAPEPQPVPPEPIYPHLEQLWSRNAVFNEQAAKLEAAADAVGDDEGLRDQLLTRAARLLEEGDYTDLEREYLRYVEEHP